MEEKRIIEKSTSELKTIQKRLLKLLKEKEQEQSVDVAQLQSEIEALKKELEQAKQTILKKEDLIDVLHKELEKRDVKIYLLRKDKRALEKELK